MRWARGRFTFSSIAEADLAKHWRESTDHGALSAAVHTIKRDLEAAYYECRENDCDDLHDDLICAEWRLRQAERRLTK